MYLLLASVISATQINVRHSPAQLCMRELLHSLISPKGAVSRHRVPSQWSVVQATVFINDNAGCFRVPSERSGSVLRTACVPEIILLILALIRAGAGKLAIVRREIPRPQTR